MGVQHVTRFNAPLFFIQTETQKCLTQTDKFYNQTYTLNQFHPNGIFSGNNLCT